MGKLGWSMLLSLNKHIPSAHCVPGRMTSSALFIQPKKIIQTSKTIRGEINVYKAVPNEQGSTREKNGELSHTASKPRQRWSFLPYFCYGLDSKHSLKTHVIEAEGGSLVKSTACSCGELVLRTHMEVHNSL